MRAGRDAMRAHACSLAARRSARRAAARRGLRHRRAVGRGGAARRRACSRRRLADAGRPRPRARCRPTSAPGSVDFAVGDMLDPALGRLRPRRRDGLADPLSTPPTSSRRCLGLAARTQQSVVFTVRAAHAGAHAHARGWAVFPRGDRAPAIAPVARTDLRRRLARPRRARGWQRRPHRSAIASGFYTSQAMELVPHMTPPSADIVTRSGELGPRSCRSPTRRRRTADRRACCGCRCSR